MIGDADLFRFLLRCGVTQNIYEIWFISKRFQVMLYCDCMIFDRFRSISKPRTSNDSAKLETYSFLLKTWRMFTAAITKTDRQMGNLKSIQNLMLIKNMCTLQRRPTRLRTVPVSSPSFTSPSSSWSLPCYTNR